MSSAARARDSNPSPASRADQDAAQRPYKERLGDRLREIRRQQGMTLHDVEDASGGRWKAVVIGAYERGDRAISAAKLAELAEFYGVPVAHMLPREERDVADATVLPAEGPIVLDLVRLEEAALNPMLRPLSRIAAAIRNLRGDHAGKVLSLRHDDLRALAVVFGVSGKELLVQLEAEGILREGYGGRT